MATFRLSQEPYAQRAPRNAIVIDLGHFTSLQLLAIDADQDTIYLTHALVKFKGLFMGNLNI